MGNSCSGFPSKGTGRLVLGNSCPTADASPFLRGKTHDPDFKWKIYGFSALFEREAIPANSACFDCCGYRWFLHVTPMHRTSGTSIPYVALCLALSPSSLKPGDVMHASFKLSIYNHSNGAYRGCKDNTITIGELFLQKKEFIKGNYTWNGNDFLALKDPVLSPKFEACGHKWHIQMHPLGDQCSTDSLSMYLKMHDPAELSHNSGKMFEVTLSILNQVEGQHYSKAGCVVFNGNGNCGWRWSDFIPLKILNDPSKGYLVASNCSMKADITCIGSSNDVQTPFASLSKDKQ